MKAVLAVLVVIAVAAEAARFKKGGKAHSHKRSLKRQAAECQPLEFKCNDGTCVQSEWTCDTDRDCPDGSDELNCPTDCGVPAPGVQVQRRHVRAERVDLR